MVKTKKQTWLERELAKGKPLAQIERELDASIANHMNNIESLKIAYWKRELEGLISEAFRSGNITMNEWIGLHKAEGIAI